MSKKKKYYVVWVGMTPGIYETWDECLRQTKGYPNAKYKSFKTLLEAQQAYSGAPNFASKASSKSSTPNINPAGYAKMGVIMDSFCVDAACSGNPGVMEYRGVWTQDQSELFRMGPYKHGTNNIGEFLGLVHALALFNKLGKHKMVIYTDSRTGMAWLRNKKVKTTLVKNAETRVIWTMIDKALFWIHNNTWDHTILKWDTKGWGEIPADFGRK